LEKARYLGAMDVRLFWYAARMYEEKGLIHFALEDYERYLRHCPEDAPTRLRAAGLFFSSGDVQRALDNYQRVLAASPKDPTATYNMALIYCQLGQYSAAKPLLEQSRSFFHDFPLGGHYALGRAYESEGRLSEAVAEYQKEYSKDPSNLPLLKTMAQAYEKTGSRDRAECTWKLAFGISPRDPLVRSKFAKIKRHISPA